MNKTMFVLLSHKMFPLFFHLILTTSISVLASEPSPNETLNMIVGIINSFDQPTSLAINVCWKQTLRRDLILKLREHSKVFQFLDNIKNLKETPAKNEVLILIDTSCSQSRVFLEEANEVKKLNAPYRWLIITKDHHLHNELVSEMLKWNMLPDSEVILPERHNNGFTIHMPYKLRPNSSQLVWEQFGTWTPGDGLKKTNTMNIPTAMRRKDLGGITIATSLVVTDHSSESELGMLQNIHIDTLSKIGYRQIIPLYDFMNATNVNIFSDTWGYLINGTWSGMIGRVVRGEAELVGTVSFLTTHRLSVLDFLSYPSPLTARFVFREPSLSYQNNLFLLPFKTTVWFCIVGLMVILTVALYLNAKWEREKMRNSETPNETVLTANVSDIAIMIVGAISQQGSSTELKGALGRGVVFLLFIAFVFLYTSYSANIVVLLQSTSSHIRTLADLYHSKLELGSEDTSYNRHLFSTATEPIRMAIYRDKIAPRGSKPNFMTLEQGVKKLQTEPFAFNMNLGTGYKAVEHYFYEHQKCDLKEIEYIQENKPWQACRKRSPYKEIYKIGLLRNQEHGLNDRENRLVYAKRPLCTLRAGSFGSVRMAHCAPALRALALGLAAAGALLLLERLRGRRAIPRREGR